MDKSPFLTYDKKKYNRRQLFMGVQWRNDLAIGVEKIDTQHKELFNRAGQLLDACNKGKGKDEIGNLIVFLEDYVVTHFKDEEELQRKYNYPEYKEHKALHDDFIVGVKGIKEKFTKEGSSLLLIVDINRKIIDWLVNHIGKVDKKLGKYINEK